MRERYFKSFGENLYLDSGNTEAIKAAQKYLNENGYTDGYGRKLEEDGVYGKNTYNAVIKYQQANNLIADGQIGDETWDSMWSNEAKKYDNMRYDVPKVKQKTESKDESSISKNRKRDTSHIAQFFYHNFNAAPSAESEAMKEELERQKRDEEYIKNNGWSNYWTTGGSNSN